MDEWQKLRGEGKMEGNKFELKYVLVGKRKCELLNRNLVYIFFIVGKFIYNLFVSTKHLRKLTIKHIDWNSKKKEKEN